MLSLNGNYSMAEGNQTDFLRFTPVSVAMLFTPIRVLSIKGLYEITL